jgi:purine-binding chemotaxis protein CheW
MPGPRLRHDPLKNLVGFVVADVHYAVPIALVREISNPLRYEVLPHAPSEVVGVADFRHEVLPVVDLRIRFGLPPTAPTRRTKWIVLRVRDRSVALVVDGVSEVFGAAADDLRPPPALGGGEDRRGIAGVARHGQRLVFVLDVDRVAEAVEPLSLPESMAADPANGSFQLAPRGGAP